MPRQYWRQSIILVALVVGAGLGLGLWKYSALRAGPDDAQAEIPEVVTAASAQTRNHQPIATSIGTVVALRSVVLRNELPGTVVEVALKSGEIVEAGAALVRLDTAVEDAELAAQQAEFELAAARLKRARQLLEQKAVSVETFEQAQAQHDVARAQVGRTRAVIARKILRAPFRARVGIADVHPGQYLDQGTLLTTLQGVDLAVHIDFTVAQQVAAGLRTGGTVDIVGQKPLPARIVAIDARIDPDSRNAMVRARVEGSDTGGSVLTPGASVRVRIPAGPAQTAVVIPTNALRRGPEGDHVFVLAQGADGATRAQLRRVQAGAALGDEVLIQSGLKAGERIAAAGSFKLRDQALVVIAPQQQAPAATLAAQ